jgi:glycosyltransferase involved in cell wall biosynthesis
MKLSIVTITVSKEKRLASFLSHLKPIADELIVFIDDATTDDSLAVARSFTDKAYLTPHSNRGTYEVRAPDIIKACTGDWIFIVADDETLSPEWTPEYIATLLENQYVTHYWVPRCWMIPPGDTFISTAPWYPDYQMRLFRNLPSLITFPAIIHESILISGEARYLADAYIYHWDLVWNARESREKKVARYKQLHPENPNEELYLYEDYYFETIQEQDLRSFARATHPPLPDTQSRFGLELKPLGVPAEMTINTGYTISLSIYNGTNAVFHASGRSTKKTDFHLTYHWLNQEGVASCYRNN